MVTIIGGYSNENSITFYTKDNKTTAFLNKDETIQIVDDTSKKNGCGCVFYIFLIILSLIKAFFLIPNIKNGNINIYYYLVYALILAVMMIYGVIKIRIDTSIN